VVWVRYVVLSGDIFVLFDLLRQFMRDRRVVLNEDSLSLHERVFVQLLSLLMRAMDCDYGSVQMQAVDAEKDNTTDPSRRLGFLREELTKYCANLGCVSWFGSVFNSFSASTVAQVHVSVAVLQFLEFISRPKNPLR